MFRLRTAAAAALTALVLVACSDDPTEPEPQCTVTNVNITSNPQPIIVGALATLAVEVASENCETAPTVTWSSSATGVAVVSSSGVVTGVAAGSANITASSGGRTSQVTVTVVNQSGPIS